MQANGLTDGECCGVLRRSRPSGLAPAGHTHDDQPSQGSQRRRPPEGADRVPEAQRVNLGPFKPHPATIAIERLEEWDPRHRIGSDDDTMQPQHAPAGPDLYLLTGREWTRRTEHRPLPRDCAPADAEQDEQPERRPKRPRSWQGGLAKRDGIYSRPTVPQA